MAWWSDQRDIVPDKDQLRNEIQYCLSSTWKKLPPATKFNQTKCAHLIGVCYFMNLVTIYGEAHYERNLVLFNNYFSLCFFKMKDH